MVNMVNVTGTAEMEQANTEPVVPSAANAPKGFVFCPNCCQHIKKSLTIPHGTEANTGICKKPCKAATAKTGDITAKAATATAKATGNGKTGKFADTAIITAIAPNPKRKGTATFDQFAAYLDGMTVAAYRKVCEDANNWGRKETATGYLAYDFKMGYISIISAEQYAADNASAE